MKIALALLAALFSLTLSVTAQAQPYPARPITMVVGFPPGGAQDIVARGLAKKMSERFGQPVVVENKPGAAGTTAMAGTARAAPDGYTLSLASLGTLVVTPLARKPSPYDPLAAFTPVATVLSQPLMLIVQESGPYKNLQDLLADGRKKSGKFNYSTAGLGSLSHFASEQLNKSAGTDFVVVPYAGSAPALRALLAGEVAMYIAAAAEVIPRLKPGSGVRALMVTLPKRFPLAPDVPGLDELGMKDPVMDQWFGLVGPAGLPKDVVARLNESVREALKDPALMQGVPGSIPLPGTPEDFAALLKAEVARTAKQIEITGFKAD